MKRKRAASIFEVGPRDGLQSENLTLDLNDREDIVAGLVAAGLRDIEMGSFVRSDRIPQLAGSGDLMTSLRKRFPKSTTGPQFWAFVPNEKGLDDATAAGVDGVSLFTAVSETFAQKNVSRGRDQLLDQCAELLPKIRARGLRHRVYVSTIHYCPFEGLVAHADLESVVCRLLDMGCDEIALSDTTGHSLPHQVSASLESFLKRAAPERFAMHFHDTRALALSNVLTALDFGVSRFDSSFGGLGGCPYAPGAAGNLATEDLIYFLSGEGLLNAEPRIEGVAAVSQMLEKRVGWQLPSKTLKTLKGGRDAR